MSAEASADAPASAPPRILVGKYRLDRPLGEGGMGVVWSGQNLDLQTRVAIKLLQPRLAEDVTARARFLREARRAASVQGEHSVRIHDVGTDETRQPYIVMEHLEGETAEARLERGKVPVETAATIMMQLLDALAEAHAKGLVHRDLKPANVFLVERPGEAIWVKVLDFGIAKLAVLDLERSVSSMTLTAPNTLVGSPQYMSPEQLRDSATVDARSDVWACGVVLFELLTGQVPFDSPSIAELFVQIVSGSPRTLASVDAEGIPGPIAKLIERCLDKDPRARPQDAHELAAALAPYAHSSARALVPRIAAWCKTEPVVVTPQRTRGMMAGGLTLVAVAGVVAFAAASWRAPAAVAPSQAARAVGSLEPLRIAEAAAGASAAPSAPSAPADAAPLPSASASSSPRPAAPATQRRPRTSPRNDGAKRIQGLGDIELIP